MDLTLLKRAIIGPTPDEAARNQDYERRLPDEGHDLTDRMRAEARMRGERAPTHRDFGPSANEWATMGGPGPGAGQFAGESGESVRPFRRKGGSPMYRDF
jgi:hypothetical protein